MAGPLPIALLLPILVTQALWVVARVPRLPEADGPRQGHAGTGTPLRMLILGDSSAAGVGVAHQDVALAGRLADRLQDSYSLRWDLWARSGITTSGALRMLSTESAREFDVAVVALGVNDTKNGMHPTRWRANYGEVIDTLQRKFSVRRIYASGVPPVGAFPALPQPLRGVLGRRASRFDGMLGALCAQRDGVIHMPFDLPIAPQYMASDGFHPSAAVYDIWADRIATALATDPMV